MLVRKGLMNGWSSKIKNDLISNNSIEQVKNKKKKKPFLTKQIIRYSIFDISI